MASPSSSSRSSFPHPTRSPHPQFTPIKETDKEEEADEPETEPERPKNFPPPTPKKVDDRQLSVLCNKCRPSSRDTKSTTVVPLDHFNATPKTLLHSILLSLTRKSPRPPSTSSPSPATATATSAQSGPTDSESWKVAAQELSRKLIHANRRRDEALLEASRLRHSVADLERKVNRLQSQLINQPQIQTAATSAAFPAAVVDARSAVRSLTRALSVHVRSSRIASLLKTPIQNTSTLLIYMESLLNQVFYQEYEKSTDEENRILHPTVRCEINRTGYEAVRKLTWEEVLSKGTKHYSEGLSKFCDKKMSEVVGLVGWARAWPESLLQAFFGAAKGVWAVYLLGRCVHPAVPILRVERGVGFDAEYMEDVIVGERVRSGGVGTPVSVRMMVAPGFYVSGGVIKCKVVCGVQ